MLFMMFNLCVMDWYGMQAPATASLRHVSDCMRTSARSVRQCDQARVRATRHACVAHSGRRDKPHDALLPPPQPRLPEAAPITATGRRQGCLGQLCPDSIECMPPAGLSVANVLCKPYLLSSRRYGAESPRLCLTVQLQQVKGQGRALSSTPTKSVAPPLPCQPARMLPVTTSSSSGYSLASAAYCACRAAARAPHVSAAAAGMPPDRTAQVAPRTSDTHDHVPRTLQHVCADIRGRAHILTPQRCPTSQRQGSHARSTVRPAPRHVPDHGAHPK